MNTSPTPAPHTGHAPTPRTYTTHEAARILHVRPQTMITGLCRRGDYMGLRPRKMPNGRLIWDAASIDALVRGEG